MSQGYLALVLHAHLPYVRHPDPERPMEEAWLHQALLECYLPLLEVWERLAAEGVPFRLTLSLSPTLLEMLDDPLLKERFRRYLESRLELAEREVWRTRDDPFHPAACLYRER
ncbi:MAG TPA: DUF1957 domain-containing protein, partial [Candidatus Nitrosotenuis sp.]|nr:DUF1957 domain-containing protein [Candidatus Nitrosotenuis sp.]